MPGVSVADSQQPALGGPVGVPEGKVRRPRPKAYDVQRERVLRRLAAEPGDILAVLAPGGFGKSTLVAQWAQASGLPVAWVNLDHADAEPEVLISSILRAVGGVAPVQWGWGPLTGDEPAFTRSVLSRLAALLEESGTPLALVLDDVHFLSKRVARVVTAVADSLPVGSRVVLVGRTSVPGLPLARWRGSGRLVEVGAHELAFDSSEIERFVSSLWDEVPSVAAVADVLEVTGGWPVAVYLTAKSPYAAIAPTRHVEEYVDTEVLRDVDPEVLAFLRATSILSSLSAPLCDAVIDGHCSSLLLRRAERESLLVARLDGSGEWFLLHPLVRERLAREFEAGEPVWAAQCHHRAAEWFRSGGYDDEAVQHAVASGVPELIAQTIWEAAGKLLLAGQRGRVLTWLDTTPPGLRERSPELTMATLWACLNGGDGVAAARWADLTRAALEPGWEDRLPDSPVGCAFAVCLALTGASGYPHGAVLAGAAFRAIPATHPMRPLARLAEGWCHVLAGDPQGEALVEDAGVRAQGAGVAVTQVQSLALAGLLRLLAGELGEGAECLTRARALWEQAGLQESHAATVFLAAVQAYASGAAGDAPTAREFLGTASGIASAMSPALPWVGVLVDALSARTHAALGDRFEATRALQRCHRTWPRVGDSPFLAALMRAAEDDVAAMLPLADLTPAERRVWDLLQTRLTQREIADQLFVSPETIKTQTSAVYRKLGVGSRREAQELGERLRAARAVGVQPAGR